MGENLNTVSGQTSAAIPIAQLIHAAGFCDWAAACKLADAIAALPSVDGEFARGVEAAAQVADEFYDKAPSTDSNFIATDIAKAIRSLSPASVGMEKDNEDRKSDDLLEEELMHVFTMDCGPGVSLTQVLFNGMERYYEDGVALNKCVKWIKRQVCKNALSILSPASESERSSSQSSEKSTGLGGRDPIDDLIDIPKGEEFR